MYFAYCISTQNVNLWIVCTTLPADLGSGGRELVCLFIAASAELGGLLATCEVLDKDALRPPDQQGGEPRQ